MTKRSQVSKTRKELQQKRLVEQLAAAYYQKTDSDPASTQLVTQEVHDEKGILIGINWWFEPKKDSQITNFLYNVTRAIDKARRDGSPAALEQALDTIAEFYAELDAANVTTQPNADGQPATTTDSTVAVEVTG